MSDRADRDPSKPCVEHAATRVRVDRLEDDVQDLYKQVEAAKKCCDLINETNHQHELFRLETMNQFDKTFASIREAMDANTKLLRKVEIFSGDLQKFMSDTQRNAIASAASSKVIKWVAAALIPVILACSGVIAYMLQATVEKSFIRDSAALQEVIDARINAARLSGVKPSKDIDKQDTNLGGLMSSN